MELIYIDSNVCMGKRGLKGKRELWRYEDILDSMDRAGIAGALVYEGSARDYSPFYGNEKLAEAIKDNDRLYGCYTIQPGYTGSFLSPAEFIRDMKEKRMVAVRMFPATHFFSTSEDVMGEYYSVLENEDVLLIVDISQIKWDNIADILSVHHNLKLLVQGVRWPDFHNLIAYMKKYQNLYTDLSNMQANFGIEILVREVGAARICMGSGLPQMSPGAARAFIDYALISDEEKQMIAGANLARLCKIALPAKVEVKNDYIAKEASEGKPLSDYVFDSHTHFLEDGGNCGSGFAMVNGDLEYMEKLSNVMGVNDYCVAPWLGIWTDSEEGNKIAVSMRARSSRVYPYVLIDPNYVTDIEKEAHFYHIEKKCPGMKMFFARTNVRYNDPVYEPWFKIANEKHLFALMDCGGHATYLSDMEELCQKYPNISFFLDHAGQSFEIAEEYSVLAKKYDNVYLQLTYTTVPEGVIEYLCSEGLADKTLYGTDAPMRDPRPQLGWVAYANISVEEKKKILGENMRKIADKCIL